MIVFKNCIYKEKREMFLLKMFKAQVPENSVAAFDAFLANSTTNSLRPLIQPTLASQAAVLGLAVDTLHATSQRRMPRFDAGVERIIRGEVFTDRTSLFVLTIAPSGPRSAMGRGPTRRRGEETSRNTSNLQLTLSYIGPEPSSLHLDQLREATEVAFGCTLEQFRYSSNRFDELKNEGRTSPPAASSEELAGVTALQDRLVRTLAIAIKASGGLLVRDLAKQLPAEARERTSELVSLLRSAGLIEGEFVVICNKTQAQTARVPTRELLDKLSAQGLKCACGRAISSEKVEEALTITELGRCLVDSSRWLTLLLLRELQEIGVPLEDTLIDQQTGGDELDLIANISGEMAFFELKDKEFSLGNAYSFGAKIGILQPRHPVIVSTEHVGNDAKDHFQRARRAGHAGYVDPFDDEGQVTEVRYIEGISNLASGIRDLANQIYLSDSARILESVLPLASLHSRSLLQALEERCNKPDDKPIEELNSSRRKAAQRGVSAFTSQPAAE